MNELDFFEITRQKRQKNKFKELSLWYILAMASMLYIVIAALYAGSFRPMDLVNKYAIAFFACVFFFIFPLLFDFIFMKLPFEFFRDKITMSEVDSSIGILEDIDLIDRQIKESTQIAERLYSNSKAYLMIGCLVSLAGVAIFYAPFWQTTTMQSTDFSLRLLDILPRFGALFFVEYIALFFLKQYRILLEDYRYYEAIKRERQQVKIFLHLLDKYKADQNLLKMIIDYLNEHSVRIPIITGDHKIQSEKALYDDMNIIGKLTELIKVAKSDK